MKINEVEALAGITKKNIRFYEEQGLLSPRRNSENGYRDYGDEEVRILRQIKLLRKLGLPIEEIRKMRQGTHTVADGMRRHLVSLERERQNVTEAIALCRSLQERDIPLDALEAGEILDRMEELERSGASFQNRQKQDYRVRYVAPVLVAVLMIGLLLAVAGLMVWGCVTDADSAPPLALVGVLTVILLAIAAGIVLALVQRIREIGKGEMDDAKKY